MHARTHEHTHTHTIQSCTHGTHMVHTYTHIHTHANTHLLALTMDCAWAWNGPMGQEG
jgi:hypothetical protein